MRNQMSDEALRLFVKASRAPMTALDESADWIGFPRNPLAIHTRDALYTSGWTATLTPTCHFLSRRFDYPDLDRSGWAIIFRLYRPDDSGPDPVEIFGGWVGAEQAALAEQLTARLNAEIGGRLGAKAATTSPPSVAPSSQVPGPPIELVGEFQETAPHRPNLPSLVEARGKRPPAHKAEVLTYLRKAKAITVSPGLNEDFFDPSKLVKGETLRTDGRYVWPDYLADYVERYDVELPAVFEHHMESQGWKLPDGLDVAKLKLPWWD
jgi:hypothetical protein